MSKFPILRAILQDATPFVAPHNDLDPKITSSIQSWLSLMKQIAELQTNEVQIFERFLYKNKNQHRRAKFFQRLRQIAKRLKLLENLKNKKFSSELNTLIDTLLKKNIPLKSVKETTPHLFNTYVLYKIFAFYCLYLEIQSLIVSAYRLLTNLLEQTFFMSTALGFIAMISRLFVFSHHIVNHTATLYNSLINVLPHYKLLNEQEIESVVVPEQISLINTLKHFQFLIGPIPSALMTFQSSHILNPSHQHQPNTKPNKKRSRKSQFKSHELGIVQDEDLGEPIDESVFVEGRIGVNSSKITSDIDKKTQNQNEFNQLPTKKREIDPNLHTKKSFKYSTTKTRQHSKLKAAGQKSLQKIEKIKKLTQHNLTRLSNK